MHFDECVSAEVAAGLRRRGIDVTTADEVHLKAETDDSHLKFATSVGRVVVTHDKDFLRMAGATPEHGGIVFVAQHAFSIGEMIEELAILAECVQEAELRNAVEFL